MNDKDKDKDIIPTESPTVEIRYFIEAPLRVPKPKHVEDPENELVDATIARRILFTTAAIIVFIIGIALLSDLW